MQSNPPNPDILANRLAALSLALADRITASPDDLSPTALAILNTLAAYPGASQAEMARIAGKSASLIVRAIDALQVQGLVDRRPGPDRRTAALVLTPAGRTRHESLAGARNRHVHDALAAVEPAHLASLGTAVDAMLTALTQGRQSADHLCRLCDETACGPDCPVEAKARRFG
jgi:MarR family transcriptional regulator, negative regulator of the multidrug operon emrRAB